MFTKGIAGLIRNATFNFRESRMGEMVIFDVFALQGRNGLGNIYVWASGDGGEDDDCNCDGYAASMWTISINSAINDGQNAHYDESCSSTLASTFSNGAKDPNTGVVSFFFLFCPLALLTQYLAVIRI